MDYRFNCKIAQTLEDIIEENLRPSLGWKVLRHYAKSRIYLQNFINWTLSTLEMFAL